MESPNEENILRANERVLDEYYRSLDLWKEPPGRRLIGVLAAFDSMFLPLALGGRPADPVVKGLQEGFGQALRWVLGSPSTRIETAASIDRLLLETAMAFISFAEKYVGIADMHRMLGRGLVGFAVSDEGRCIRFIPIDPDGRSEFEGLVDSICAQKSAHTPVFTEQDQSRLESALAACGWQTKRGRVRLQEFPSCAVRDINSFLEQAYPAEPLPLDSADDLEGFTVAELRKVCAALQAWSYVCLVGYVRTAQAGMPQDECMPTQIVAQRVLVERVARATGLGIEPVRRVLERMTFGVGSTGDPLLRPFIPASGGLCWSPFFLLNYRPERNVLRVMTQDPKLKHVADTLIGNREHRLVEEVAALFAQHGYEAQAHTKLSSRESKAELDLLLHSARAAEEVLLVECKAVLTPDEIAEVGSVTEQMKHGQSQLERCGRILRSSSIATKQAWFPGVDWGRVKHYRQLIVSGDAEPNTSLDLAAAPAISLVVMRARLTAEDFSTPSSVISGCRDRRWQSAIRELEVEYERIALGEISYELPVVSLSHQELDAFGLR